MTSSKFFDFSSKIFRQRALLFLLWAVIAVGLFSVRSVLLPFILATLIAYVFHPVVGFLGRIKIKGKPIPRFVSVLIIYLVFILAVVLVAIFFVPQFYREVIRLAKEASILINSIDENTISEFGQKLESFFRRYQLPFEITMPGVELDKSLLPLPTRPNNIAIDLLGMYHNIANYIISWLSSESKNIVYSAQHFAQKFASFMFMLVLVLMITAFMLVDVARIKRFVFSMVPKKDRDALKAFLDRLDQRLSGVVRGQLTICLINAALTLVGLLILRIKFAFILATLAGIFSLVPIFGSIVSTVPIVLVALTISPLKALLALIWIIAIHALEANFLNPKIMGHSAKIHPVLIVLALLAGEHYYGIVGALLAVPIMSIIITIFYSILGKAQQMDEGLAKPVRGDRIPS